MDEQELLPCPFCKGPVHHQKMGDILGCFHIGEAWCPTVSHRMMTIEQWNHRTAKHSTKGWQDDDVVEQLKEALTEIARGMVKCADGSHVKMTAFRMKSIARAALDALKQSS